MGLITLGQQRLSLSERQAKPPPPLYTLKTFPPPLLLFPRGTISGVYSHGVEVSIVASSTAVKPSSFNLPPQHFLSNAMFAKAPLGGTPHCIHAEGIAGISTDMYVSRSIKRIKQCALSSFLARVATQGISTVGPHI